MLIKHGDKGEHVAAIHLTLCKMGLINSDHSPELSADALGEMVFDTDMEQAVRQFQQLRGLDSDGIVGQNTLSALQEASFSLGERELSLIVSRPMIGDDVWNLQNRLHTLGFYTGTIDGRFGPTTHMALSTFQSELGLSEDGVCGPETLTTLENFNVMVKGGSPSEIHQIQRLRDSGAHLAGKKVLIDPGPGLNENATDEDRIRLAQESVQVENDILMPMADILATQMSRAGIDVYRSRPLGSYPTNMERADIANAFEVDLVISLRMDSHPNPAASGIATYYFGNSNGSVSVVGQLVADFIHRELVSRTGLQDCRTHGRTWPLLRSTRMPAVKIFVGYSSNAEDMAALSDPQLQERIVEGIVVAIKRAYLIDSTEHETGKFSLEELIAYEKSQQR